MRGRLNHSLRKPRWNLNGDILAVSYLDALYKNESKLIVNSEVALRYILNPKLHFIGQLNHFQKSFYRHARSYLWTEYETATHIFPGHRFSLFLAYRQRATTFSIVELIRFKENDFEIKYLRRIGKRIYLEGLLIQSRITHRDYKAEQVSSDSLVLSPEAQKDTGIEALFHIRYQRGIICGIQIGKKQIQSNSVIGKYDQVLFQIYLSGHWGQSSFYHIVFQRVAKTYSYPQWEGISSYRDPEEPTHNRTYVRFERVLKRVGTAYFQISLLQNETILNQRYYDKTKFEAGIKYTL